MHLKNEGPQMISKLILFTLFCVTPVLAQVCDAPATGKSIMVLGVMSYCNGTSWISMKGAQGTACVAGDTGKMRFESAKLEFCDGSFWFEMKSGSAIASCTSNTGRMRWSSNRYEFCDGTSWFDTTEP